MRRRDFFSRLAGACGIIALASQLAFRTPQKAFVDTLFLGKRIPSFWIETRRWSHCTTAAYRELLESGFTVKAILELPARNNLKEEA